MRGIALEIAFRQLSSPLSNDVLRGEFDELSTIRLFDAGLHFAAQFADSLLANRFAHFQVSESFGDGVAVCEEATGLYDFIEKTFVLFPECDGDCCHELRLAHRVWRAQAGRFCHGAKIVFTPARGRAMLRGDVCRVTSAAFDCCPCV